MSAELKSEAIAQNGNGHANGNGHERESNAGRKPKLSEKITKRIVKAIERGNAIKNACKMAGISHTAFCNWCNDGQLGLDPKKVEFLARIEAAKAKAEDLLVSRVVSASRSDWKAGLAILERRNPEDWLKRDYVRTEITGANGGPVKQETTVIERHTEPERLAELAREFLKERDEKLAANGR